MTGGINGHAKVGQTNANIEELHDDLDDVNATLGEIADTDGLVLDKLTATGVTTSDIASNTATTNAHLAYIEGTQDAANTKLDTANGLLSDIKTQGVAVNVNTDTLESLTGTTNTKLDQLHTDHGNEGSAPPALNGSGASGILGYLRNQVDKLNTIASQMTSGAQIAKIGDGTTTATIVSGDTKGLSGAYVSKLIAFTSAGTGAQEIGTTDCLGYEWAFIYVASGGGGANVVAQLSDDGASNWGSAPQFDPSAVSVAPVTFTTLQSGGSGYIVPLARRWLRLHGTALTSGTFSGTITLHTSPCPALPGYKLPALSGTTTITGTVGTGVGGTADALSASTSVVVYQAGFNGTTWDRIRTGVQILGTYVGRQVVAANTAPLRNLSAVTVTGAGSSIDSGTSFSKWALQVTLAGTTPTATVLLQGSLNGTDWTTLTTWATPTQASGEIIWVQDKLVRYVRANVNSIGGTGATVTADIAGGVG